MGLIAAVSARSDAPRHIASGDEQRFTHAKSVTQTEMTIYRSMEPGIGFEQDRPVGAAGAAGHCPT
jgi:hypothetical protein